MREVKVVKLFYAEWVTRMIFFFLNYPIIYIVRSCI